jgi:hypothetical protein
MHITAITIADYQISESFDTIMKYGNVNLNKKLISKHDLS